MTELLGTLATTDIFFRVKESKVRVKLRVSKKDVRELSRFSLTGF